MSVEPALGTEATPVVRPTAAPTTTPALSPVAKPAVSQPAVPDYTLRPTGLPKAGSAAVATFVEGAGGSTGSPTVTLRLNPKGDLGVGRSHDGHYSFGQFGVGGQTTSLAT